MAKRVLAYCCSTTMSLSEDKTKYSNMEAVLQAINKNYISLAEDSVKRNNPILLEIIDKRLIPKMKSISELFKIMFNMIYYGGSYYDGLKVGQPEEYDLDLLLVLPKTANPQFLISDTHGYVYVQLLELERLLRQPEGAKYEGLKKFLDKDNFILTSKLYSWIEGLISKVLNSFDKEDKSPYVTMNCNNVPTQFYLSLTKSGPALTITISGTVGEEKVVMDVDIVPSLKCTKWPESEDYKPNPCPKKSDFFVVPKGPSREASMEKYWRLSFQDQEREILNGYQRLKPTIRLLKRLRDYQKQDSVASYFMKTIFLLTLEEEELIRCWKTAPLSYCFMKGLQLYENHLRQCSIPFYWNTKQNLLINLKRETCVGFANKLKKIYDDITTGVHLDPFIVANYLLPEDEIESLKGSVNLGKKIERKVLANRSLSYNETALIMSPMDRLNLDILGNSMDTDEGFSSSGSSSESGNTMKEILALLKSIDSKVSRLERRFDDLERKINGKAGDQKSSLLEKFVGLSIGGNGAFNVLQ